MKARVENHGTVYLFCPLDDEAKAWIDENVGSDHQTWGGALVVEHRYIEDLCCGFAADGGEGE